MVLGRFLFVGDLDPYRKHFEGAAQEHGAGGLLYGLKNYQQHCPIYPKYGYSIIYLEYALQCIYWMTSGLTQPCFLKEGQDQLALGMRWRWPSAHQLRTILFARFHHF